jgi:hypothetical protein
MRTGMAMLSALVLSATVAAAQDAEGERKYWEVDTAAVVAVDPEAGTLRVRGDDGLQTFHVDEHTWIRSGAERTELAALEPDDRVVVNARRGLPSQPLEVDYIQLVVDDESSPDPGDRADTKEARDAAIEDAVELRIRKSGFAQERDVVVLANDGVVTLRGDVESAHEREEAERLAKAVEGVRSVRNELRVAKRDQEDVLPSGARVPSVTSPAAVSP